MGYIEEIVLNWILYNSEEVYTYKAKCKITRFVKEKLDDALKITSYLYSLGYNSKVIINYARGNRFVDNMNYLKNKADNFSTRYGNLLEEKFLSENVNKNKHENEHVKHSYLENLLLKLLANSNTYSKDSNEYQILSNLICKRPDDVFEAIFICNWQEKNIKEIIDEAIKKNCLEKEVDKILVISRNLKLLYKDKYQALRNDFILSIESNIDKDHSDIENNFYSYEEEKTVNEWLNSKENISKTGHLLLEWWGNVSEFTSEQEEYKIVTAFITNHSEDFLDAIMAMHVLGINIERTINLALRGSEFEFEELMKQYILASVNLKIYFKDAYNKNDFIKSLNTHLKRERRKKNDN